MSRVPLLRREAERPWILPVAGSLVIRRPVTGLARIVLGVPLTAVVAIVVVWAFRRTTNRLVTPARVASQRGPR